MAPAGPRIVSDPSSPEAPRAEGGGGSASARGVGVIGGLGARMEFVERRGGVHFVSAEK